MIKWLNFTKSNRYPFYLFILLVWVLSGCVSTSKYQALQTDYDALKTDRDVLQTDRNALQTENDTLKKEKNELQEDNLQLQEVNQQLQTEVDELQKEKIEQLSQTESQIEVSQTMMADFKEESQSTIDELKEEIDAKTDLITVLEKTQKAKLVDKIFFESASAEVTKEGRKILFRIAPILKEAKDKEIHIVGHCDRLPPGASISKQYPSNWELSTARATAISQILQWGYGIDAGRIVAVGVAHYRPIYTESEKISAKNRVVEIFLAPPKKLQE